MLFPPVVIPGRKKPLRQKPIASNKAIGLASTTIAPTSAQLFPPVVIPGRKKPLRQKPIKQSKTPSGTFTQNQKPVQAYQLINKVNVPIVPVTALGVLKNE
jgi:hypothetical protein